ncbi:heme-binding protein [Candidatus Marinimicrobia bacterium]|nr:heme-binding protein [Candidatus Neomarinimicrobiota bacterium]
MNKTVIIFVVVILGLICFNMVWGLSNSMLETPKYKLIKKSGSFEIRQYDPVVIAKTQVQSAYKEATSTGFRRIANYIFGGNDKNVEIAMTAPVITDSPEDANGSYEVLFIMPSAYDTNKLPKPNSPNVEILERELGRVASMSFGGWATSAKIKTYQQKLSKWISNQQLQTLGNFKVAQYNSPWALPPFRHNEILIKIAQ